MPKDLVDTLIELAADRFGRDAASLSPRDDLFDALGIDSLQALDLLTELENRYDIEIPDYELQDVRTFDDLAELVERRR
jgi:acyl carrier protein